MGDFVNNVRAGRVPQPRHRRFDADAWQCAYHSSRTDTEDDHLFAAGLWFRDRIAPIWKGIDCAGWSNQSSTRMRRQLCGAANLEVVLVNREADETLEAEKTLAHVVAQRRFSSGPTDPGLTTDEYHTAIGEALSIAMSYILGQSDTEAERETDKSGMNPDSRWLLSQFNMVSILENRWLRCLFLDSVLTVNGDQATLRFRDSKLSYFLEMAENRRQLMSFVGYANIQRVWDAGMPPPRSIKIVDRFDLRDGKLRFDLKSPKPGRDEVPFGLAMRYSVETMHMGALVEKKFSDQSDLTISDLLDGFVCIQSLAEALRKKLTRKLATWERGRDKIDIPLLMQMAPRIRANDLARFVQATTNKSRKKAAAIVEFLTYRGRARDGIWAKPLLDIGDRCVALPLSTTLAPNLDRSIDHWLLDAGLPIAERGLLFEDYVRSTLKTLVSRNRILFRSTAVHEHSATISSQREKLDADLLIRIGSTVFIGELKCRTFPTEPKELRWHLRDLERAAKQAGDRAILAAKNRPGLAKMLKFEVDPDRLSFVPFVLINSAVGSGMKFDGIPVTDIDSLVGFFRKPDFTIGHDGEGKGGALIELYKTPQEAEENLIVYLSETPSMALRRAHSSIAETRRRYPAIPDVEFIEIEMEISLPESPAEIQNAMAAAAEDWRERIRQGCTDVRRL